MRFTCPRCGMVSHNPRDALEGWCGACCARTARDGSASAVLATMDEWHSREVRVAPRPPDSDPIADLQQARGLMERYAEAHPDPDCTVGDIVRALRGAGLSATAEFSVQLLLEQYEAAHQAMEQFVTDWEAAAGRDRTRREHRRTPGRVNRARRRQVLDDAEARIARLDGEGYGVADKARYIEAVEGTTPPECLDADHAMSWTAGDPAL